jgi:hypothetical protein
MDWNKMDLIIIMDLKCILFVTRRTYMKKEVWTNKTMNEYCNWEAKLKQ